jgi:hypothetical protein
MNIRRLLVASRGREARTVPMMDVSIRARKVTRVMLARRTASLRPLRVCLAGSSLVVVGTVGS